MSLYAVTVLLSLRRTIIIIIIIIIVTNSAIVVDLNVIFVSVSDVISSI